jgi:hypothetical protein
VRALRVVVLEWRDRRIGLDADRVDPDSMALRAYEPTVERGSWEAPVYYELLRRAIRWAMGEDS